MRFRNISIVCPILLAVVLTFGCGQKAEDSKSGSRGAALKTKQESQNNLVKLGKKSKAEIDNIKKSAQREKELIQVINTQLDELAEREKLAPSVQPGTPEAEELDAKIAALKEVIKKNKESYDARIQELKARNVDITELEMQ